MNPIQVTLVVAVVIVAVVIGFALGRARNRPAQLQQTQQAQQAQQIQQTQFADPAALRKQRLDEARQRRFEMEQRVAEEDALLREEEDCDFLKQELKDIRDNRRLRKKGQPKP